MAGPQGDTPFTLILEQTGEKVEEGSVDSPSGGTQPDLRDLQG